jgi:membrane associated rhomboid family serine protease
MKRPQTSRAILTICCALAALSTAVWSLPSATQNKLVVNWGFVPMLFTASPWRASVAMVTASFLHADLFHLLGNCWFLWIFGRSLESLFGPRVIWALFPVAGVSGFLLHWVAQPNGLSPVIGASASISSVMGAYMVLFPKARIRTVILLGWFVKFLELPSWIFLLYWIGLQIFEQLYFGNQSSVAYAAHIGGFILGVIGAMAWKVSAPFAEEKLLALEKIALSKTGNS